jgi:hypothetical protein
MPHRSCGADKGGGGESRRRRGRGGRRLASVSNLLPAASCPLASYRAEMLRTNEMYVSTKSAAKDALLKRPPAASFVPRLISTACGTHALKSHGKRTGAPCPSCMTCHASAEGYTSGSVGHVHEGTSPAQRPMPPHATVEHAAPNVSHRREP